MICSTKDCPDFLCFSLRLDKALKVHIRSKSHCTERRTSHPCSRMNTSPTTIFPPFTWAVPYAAQPGAGCWGLLPLTTAATHQRLHLYSCLEQHPPFRFNHEMCLNYLWTKIIVLSIIQKIQAKYSIKVMIWVSNSYQESKWDIKHRYDPNAYTEHCATAVPHQGGWACTWRDDCCFLVTQPHMQQPPACSSPCLFFKCWFFKLPESSLISLVSPCIELRQNLTCTESIWHLIICLNNTRN